MGIIWVWTSSSTRHSGHHDEMLFIIIHQVSELWIKLVLHEAEAALKPFETALFQNACQSFKGSKPAETGMGCIGDNDPRRLHRISRLIGHSSGFQSYQYRVLEFC